MSQNRSGGPREPQVPHPHSEDADWIFDLGSGVQPTERLPDREDFERLRMERAALNTPPERRFARPERDDTRQASMSGDPTWVREPAPTGEIPVIDAQDDGDHEHESAYARSGSTPSPAPGSHFTLPPRFRDLSGWDAARDVLALVCFGSAFVTLYGARFGATSTLFPRLGASIGILALITAYVLRWAPTYFRSFDPDSPEPSPTTLRAIGLVRTLGMAPAFLAGAGLIVYDLVMSVPDLLTPLPEGPRVGIGVGAALLMLGASVGYERRGFEGHVPTRVHYARAARVLSILRILALASFAIALIMMFGKAFHGDLLFAVVTLAKSLGGLALALLILNPDLRVNGPWYVFLTGAAGLLVIGSLADNSLRFDFAAPASFSTSYVWLPFVLTGFGVLISRTYVRSAHVSFTRVDWLVYAARALEFSILMHAVACVAVVLMTGAILAGYDAHVGPFLSFVNLLIVLVFLGLSILARRSLIGDDATKARSHAVSASAALSILGFLSVIVFSLASGSAAGLTNGGLALAVGLSAALLLTVPPPVRDEHGAPDLEATMREFHQRLAATRIQIPFLPDISRETADRRGFPSAS